MNGSRWPRNVFSECRAGTVVSTLARASKQPGDVAGAEPGGQCAGLLVPCLRGDLQIRKTKSPSHPFHTWSEPLVLHHSHMKVTCQRLHHFNMLSQSSTTSNLDSVSFSKLRRTVPTFELSSLGSACFGGFFPSLLTLHLKSLCLSEPRKTQFLFKYSGALLS